MGPSVSPQGRVSRQAPPGSLQEVGGADFCLGVEEFGSTLHLRLSGEFDFPCIGRVEAALERVSDKDTSQVVFDLSELDFLDLAGLKTILRANERARDAAFDVVVVRPRGLANRVFTLTRAGEQLNLVDQAFPATSGAADGGLTGLQAEREVDSARTPYRRTGRPGPRELGA